MDRWENWQGVAHPAGIVWAITSMGFLIEQEMMLQKYYIGELKPKGDNHMEATWLDILNSTAMRHFQENTTIWYQYDMTNTWIVGMVRVAKAPNRVTHLQITTNCLRESWIECCIPKYAIIYWKSHNTGKKHHSLQNIPIQKVQLTHVKNSSDGNGRYMQCSLVKENKVI